ncbi:MAG: hypothetical protein CMJ83_14135 [Planctomycetes bacterium]|nr:hypothetical protein [Planctomycetota bacterium]
MRTKLILSLGVALALTSSSSAQPAVASPLSGGGWELAVAATPGGAPAPVAGLGSITFLDAVWTNELESFTPRSDIPRTEEFQQGRRVRLPNGSRIYRVLTTTGTAMVRVDARSMVILGQVAGDGLTSGFAPGIGAASFAPYAAFTTLGASPRVYVVRTDTASPTLVDVTPVGGLSNLAHDSLAVVQDAVFFSADATLHRVDLNLLITQPIALPGAPTWVDSEIAISGDGTTIALRAGSSGTACRLMTLDASGTNIAAYGTDGPVMELNYADPSQRPAYSLSHDGLIAPYFKRTATTIEFYMAENYGLNLSPLLGTLDLQSVIGIESEIALGDGTGSGRLVTFVPLPFFGNMLVSLPYPMLQFLLNLGGPGGFFGALNGFSNFGLFGPGVSPVVTVDGHFRLDPFSSVFFILGPQGSPRNLVQIAGSNVFGRTRLTGIEQVLDVATLGADWLVVRAETTTVPGQGVAAFFVPISGGHAIDSSVLGPGDISGLAVAPGGHVIAAVHSNTPAGDTLWVIDGSAGVITSMTTTGWCPGVQWSSSGAALASDVHGNVVSLAVGGVPVLLATAAPGTFVL